MGEDQLSEQKHSLDRRASPLSEGSQHGCRVGRSPRKNWVEKAGGLPDYIERIAVHVHEKGHPISTAIPIAISTAKKSCATGEVFQWPGIQNINLGSRAEACNAVRQWEALKAKAKAKNMSNPSGPCCAEAEATTATRA